MVNSKALMEILKPRSIVVTDDFIQHAEYMAVTINTIRRENIDSLLLEWYLIQENIVKKPYNWRHDFIYKDMYIDAKEVSGKNFNIHRLYGPQTKMDQFKESIIIGDLTHFLFYKTDKDHTSVLKAGDVVNIEPIALCEARSIIKACVDSNMTEKYEAFVSVDTIKLLGENHETILENS